MVDFLWFFTTNYIFLMYDYFRHKMPSLHRDDLLWLFNIEQSFKIKRQTQLTTGRIVQIIYKQKEHQPHY